MAVTLEKNCRLSDSVLWRLQRSFFEGHGIAAWGAGGVPQYVTSNPFIAHAFAKVIFGYLRDCRAAEAPASFDPGQPVYILELGAGSGRFSYHFLKKLLDLIEGLQLQGLACKLIMTDFADRLLSDWQNNPLLQRLVDQGCLDFARFDAEHPGNLELVHSGEVLSRETVKNPLVVLANYFFDSIPQDAFYIKDGKLHERLITLTVPQGSTAIEDTECLRHADIAFSDQPADAEYYDDPAFNGILRHYRERLEEGNVLFPYAALRCVRHFLRMSGGRLLMMSADKGSCLEEEVPFLAPEINVHGSFSMMVNYHALDIYAEAQGGRTFHTPHRHTNLHVSACLFGGGRFPETGQAYAEAIAQFGPDDFFMLKKGMERAYDLLTLTQITAYLRLSGWDSDIFLGCFPALLGHASSASDMQRQELRHTLLKVWEAHYPVDERRDLAFHLGMAFYGAAYFAEALDFFQRSAKLHGSHASTAYNMGLCHYRLGRLEPALARANEALEFDPTLEAAKELRAKIQDRSGHSA